MSSLEFCYWLKGFLDSSAVTKVCDDDPLLTDGQVEFIQGKLQMVLAPKSEESIENNYDF